MAKFNKEDINAEELSKYEKKYNEKDFFGKLKKYAKAIGKGLVEQALTLYYVMKKPEVPMKYKTLILGALGYLISPIDFIPDIVPVIGYTDDLAAVAFALMQIQDYVDDDIKNMAAEKTSEIFD